MHRPLNASLLLTALGTSSTECYAHARWLVDGPIKPRDPSTELTTAPCGGIARTKTPAVFTPGQTLTVEWEETIDHPGYYLISFSPAGDANFEQYVLTPKIVDTQNNTPTPHRYQAQITLPDQACTECTLQLIQVMEEDPLNPVSYYSCADIQLTADPGGPPSPVTDAVAISNPNGVTLTWTAPPNASTLVLMDTATIANRPANGTRYSIGQRLGTSQVVYQGAASTFNVPPLTAGVTYYFLLAAFDNQLRYATPAFTTATLTADSANSAPVVTLRVTQDGREVTQVAPDGGRIEVKAQVSDPNAGDQQTYDWSQSDNRLIDEDSNPDTLTINPRPLPATTYAVRLMVTDTGEPPASTLAALDLVVTAPSPPIPTVPDTPTIPDTPTVPGQPTTPGNPTTPGTPGIPGSPMTPVNPPMPVDPTAPGNPNAPDAPATPGNPATPRTPTPIPTENDNAAGTRGAGSGAMMSSSLLWLLALAAVRSRLFAPRCKPIGKT